MKRYILFFIIAVVAFPGIVSAQIQTAQVTGGTVEGVLKDGIASFKGIPFAAPPVGNLRWRAPQPVIPWNGIKKADTFGPAPIQDINLGAKYFQNPNVSEDCLYINVWTAAKSAGEKRPVIVWIHGGGFASGSPSIPAYQGTEYAKRGLVYVSSVYRVGPMGFLAHPDLSKESGRGSGCYGIQDQVAGLKWIQENIAKFGGDPDNVTIFGQSAGGFSVSILSIVPEAKGLFHRMICQSGTYMTPLKYGNEEGTHNFSLKLAEKNGKEMLHKLGADNIEAARALSAETIQAAVPEFFTLPYWPVADGYTIPGDGYELYKQGKFNDVPALVGSNSDEGAFFVQANEHLTPEGFEKMIRENYGPASEAILKAYPHATAAETFKSQKDIWRDTMFGWPSWASSDLHAQKSKHNTFLYYYDYHDAKSPDGSTHGDETPYTLLFKPGIKGAQLTESDKAMMDLIGNYWINFARTGDPNGAGLPVWPKYDAKGKGLMIFDENSGAGSLPNIEKYKALDQYYSWRRKQNKGQK